MAKKHKIDFAAYLSANVLVAAIPFLLLPVLTRFLGPEGYGVVAMFMAYLGMLGAVIGLSVHGAISRRWFDQDELVIAEYVSSCIFIIFVTSLFGLLFVFIFSKFLYETLSLSIFWVRFTILISMCNSVILVRLITWQLEGKSKFYGSLQFALALTSGLLSLYLIVVKHADFSGRLWGHSIAYIAIAFFSFASLMRQKLLIFKIQWFHVKDALKFGIPLIPHVIGAFLLLTIDRMIINNYIGLKSVGIYMVAIQFALAINLLSDSFNKVFVPWLFEQLKNQSQVGKLRAVKVTYGFAGFLIVCVFASVLLGPFFVELIAGEEFKEAGYILPILVLAQGFHGMYYLVTNYIFFEMKTYLTAAITIVCGLFSVSLTYFLVNKYGMSGAAISQVIAMLALWLVTWYAANKVYPMPWFKFNELFNMPEQAR